MTSVLDDVDVDWLRSLFNQEAACQLRQLLDQKHPCSQKATHVLRMRCGSRPRALTCQKFYDFFAQSLVPGDYYCRHCRIRVSVCWELIPV